MSNVEQTVPPRPSIKGDRRLKRKLRELCQRDNSTNFVYIAKVYIVLILTIGGAIWLNHVRAAAGLSLWWSAGAAFSAILIVGASHHQLAGAGHEAAHHTLFKNRLLNELASDWLCMFPIFSTTYSFRLFHLAHHQFVNDPQRDPDFALLERSGHWLTFPVSKTRFMRAIASQIFLVGLLRYIIARFQFNAVTTGTAGPYQRSGKNSNLAVRIGKLYVLGVLLVQIPLFYHGDAALLISVSAMGWLTLAAFFFLLRDRFFPTARLRPVLSRRVIAISRTGYLTVLFTGLTCLQMLTGEPAWWYFLCLWVVPLLTTFSLFMILRQLIQHGNGDRGWITNTRVFLVNRFLRYAVFPFGMDYHLPHHMYAAVPHYNLPELHRFLSRYPEYAEQALVVENYLVPKRRPSPHPRSQCNPTCLEVIGPEYTRNGQEIFIDHSVLDAWEVDEPHEIRRCAEKSSAATGQAAPLYDDPPPRPKFKGKRGQDANISQRSQRR